MNERKNHLSIRRIGLCWEATRAPRWIHIPQAWAALVAQAGFLRVRSQCEKSTYQLKSKTGKRILALNSKRDIHAEPKQNNGGFHQFFFNDAGKLAGDALRGLEFLGAEVTAGILRRAMAIFPGSVVPAGQKERREYMCDSLTDKQEELQDFPLANGSPEMRAQETSHLSRAESIED